MSIVLSTELENRLRSQAIEAGLTLERYVERLIQVEPANEEIARAAMEGLESGPSHEVGEAYWAEKHRRLDERMERLRSTTPR